MRAAAATGEFSVAPGVPVDRALARLGVRGAEIPRPILRAYLPALVFWVPLALLAWLRPAGDKERLDASGDVQCLADIGGRFERVYAMRPLLLTAMPLRDLLKLFMQAMI